MTLRLQEKEENVYDYFSQPPYKDLLKAKELIHYVADDTTPQILSRNSPKMVNFYTKFEN